MKKLITAMLCLMPIMAFGVDVCVKNNTYIMILNNDVSSGTTESNDTTKVWKVTFGGGTDIITGEAACNEISGTVKSPITNLYTDAEDTGTYCWCRMWPTYGYETGPSSYWILLKQFSTAALCESGDSGTEACATACASAVEANTDGFRTAMFEAVW